MLPANIFSKLDQLQPLVRQQLSDGKLVVITGRVSSGKSHLARKSLPDAKPAISATEFIGQNLIADNLYTSTDVKAVTLQCMTAHRSGGHVIMVASSPKVLQSFLRGLDPRDFVKIDLNQVWANKFLTTPQTNLAHSSDQRRSPKIKLFGRIGAAMIFFAGISVAASTTVNTSQHEKAGEELYIRGLLLSHDPSREEQGIELIKQAAKLGYGDAKRYLRQMRRE